MTFETPEDVIEELVTLILDARYRGEHVKWHQPFSSDRQRCAVCAWDERRDRAIEYAEELRREREEFTKARIEDERIEAR